MPEPGAATAAFFEDLSSRGHIPLLHNTSGTIRIDLDEGGGTTHWYIRIDNCSVKVSHRSSRADAVLRTTAELFDKMATGKANSMAALLRDVLKVEGDMGLVAAFARLFPGPPRSQATFLERQKEAAAR